MNLRNAHIGSISLLDKYKPKSGIIALFTCKTAWCNITFMVLNPKP